MGQDSPTSLQRLSAILREVKFVASTKLSSADNLTKIRADVRTAAEFLLKHYPDSALDRAKLLEGRPDATYFARLVTKEVEQMLSEQPKR